MKEIEKQATTAWGSSTGAIAAWDFMRVMLPVTRPVERPVMPVEMMP
jgi:hypothetical protein